MKNKKNRVIKFSGSFSSNRKKRNPMTQTFWVDGKQVSELEYYEIDDNTTLEDIGDEPFDYIEYQFWKQRKMLIEQIHNPSPINKILGF